MEKRVLMNIGALQKSAYFFIQEAQHLEEGEPDEEEIRRAKMYRQLAREIADLVDSCYPDVRQFEIRPLKREAGMDSNTTREDEE